MKPDPPHVERRASWRGEHLDCICGLANGRGGVLDIGRDDRREAIGVTDLRRLAKEIPIKVRSVLSIVVNVHVRTDRGRDYLRIVVPSHPDRALPRRSARKQPEHPDQPEDHQKTTRKPPETRGFHQNLANRILAFLRENPTASRREIAAALEDTTEGSVRYRLDKLKEVGRLRRIGPDRGGHWEVIDDPDVESSEHTDGGPVKHRDPGTAQPAIIQKTSRKRPGNRQKTARNGSPPPESARLADRILALLRRSPSASRREIAATLGTTRSTVRYRLDRLREAGRIERVGPDKGGHWKVLGEPTTESNR